MPLGLQRSRHRWTSVNPALATAPSSADGREGGAGRVGCPGQYFRYQGTFWFSRAVTPTVLLSSRLTCPERADPVSHTGGRRGPCVPNLVYIFPVGAAFVASGDADTTMAESALAILAGRGARCRAAAVATGVSSDPARDGLQPETRASTATARASVRRMARDC